jgi:hypothetical protein
MPQPDDPGPVRSQEIPVADDRHAAGFPLTFPPYGVPDIPGGSTELPALPAVGIKRTGKAPAPDRYPCKAGLDRFQVFVFKILDDCHVFSSFVLIISPPPTYFPEIERTPYAKAFSNTLCNRINLTLSRIFQMKKNLFSFLSITLAFLTFIGCSGSGSDDDTVDTDTEITFTGKAVDGYLSGATVCLDNNNNARCESTEVSTKTGSDGSYTLKVKKSQIASTARIIVTGGIDTSTGASFNGILKAPADTRERTLNLSPLTTLVAAKIGSNSNTEIDNAKTAVAATLGLEADTLSSDPMQQGLRFKRALQVQRIIELYSDAENNASQVDLDLQNKLIEKLSAILEGTTEMPIGDIVDAVADRYGADAGDGSLPQADTIQNLLDSLVTFIDDDIDNTDTNLSLFNGYASANHMQKEQIRSVIQTQAAAGSTYFYDATAFLAESPLTLMKQAQLQKFFNLIGYTDHNASDFASFAETIACESTVEEFKTAVDSSTLSIKTELQTKLNEYLGVSAGAFYGSDLLPGTGVDFNPVVTQEMLQDKTYYFVHIFNDNDFAAYGNIRYVSDSEAVATYNYTDFDYESTDTINYRLETNGTISVFYSDMPTLLASTFSLGTLATDSAMGTIAYVNGNANTAMIYMSPEERDTFVQQFFDVTPKTISNE